MDWDDLGIFGYGRGVRPVIVVRDTDGGTGTEEALYRYTDEKLQTLCEDHGVDFDEILSIVNIAISNGHYMVLIDVPTYLKAKNI